MAALLVDHSKPANATVFAPPCSPDSAPAYDGAAEYRRRVFMLVRKFQRAVADPLGRTAALDLLRLIHICLTSHFAMSGFLREREGNGESTGQAKTHRNILRDIKLTIERFAAADATVVASDLAHVLDSFLINEAAALLSRSTPSDRPPEFQATDGPFAMHRMGRDYGRAIRPG
jgi:hypothetical protein